jgi:imidazolonepropionase
VSLLIRGARVVLANAPAAPRRGAALRDAMVLPCGDVLIEGGRIVEVGSVRGGAARVIEAGGRVLTPGLVDCHTHACWAGSRIDEWERKLTGVPYLEILKAGGGIMSTVRATRGAGHAALVELTSKRLGRMLRAGTTTVEVKSGYGLTGDAELGMLRAIAAAGAGFPGTVVPTALLGHAIEGEERAFVAGTIGGTLDAVHAEFPGIAVDAYCETGAWSVASTVALMARARSLGHVLRVHTDQFNALGMVQEAVRLGARSVDHLEASGDGEIEAIAGSETAAVLLPICGMHLDGRYARGRALADAGAVIAVATNHNPGSAPSGSMPVAMGAAVRGCGLTAREAIVAGTVNAAWVLGLGDRGVVTPGARADLALWDIDDERELGYRIGDLAPSHVMCGGEIAC